MCFHDKPVKNTNELRAPALKDGDTILYDEPGRCKPQVNGKGETDYHSHHFRLVNSGHGHYHLLVRHGGGDERIDMGYSYTRLAELLAPMDSDARYLMLHALYTAHENGDRAGYERTSKRYEEAFVSGELRKRKVRGTSGYRVFFKLRIADLMGAK